MSRGTTLMHSLDWLVTMALEVGPHGRLVLPALGSLVGLCAFGLLFVLVSQRVAWRIPDLVRAMRTSFHGSDVGEPVVLLGRLRAPGNSTIASFERADRRAVVSSLHEPAGSTFACVATRAAPGLELATSDVVVPLEGLLDVRRTRASRVARNIGDHAASRARAPGKFRAADLHEGQWVLAMGVVGRVVREALRETAGPRGLSGGSTPIVLIALRPELPRWTIPVAFLGAFFVGTLASPLPWRNPELALFEVEPRPAWCGVTAVRLLGPTRSELVASMPDSSADVAQREWALLAARERGDCIQVATILTASRRDEEALETIDRCGVETDRRWRLLRETGQSQEALEAADARLGTNERAALELEAGHVTQHYADWLSAGTARPPTSDLACDASCLLAIRDAGDSALQRAEVMLPLRGRGLDCRSAEITALLAELGLVCGRHDAAAGLRAVRLAPRNLDRMIPLTEVEVRLHVTRLLLDAAGESAEADQIRVRQRRILAVLSTPGGTRAELYLRYHARPHSLPQPEHGSASLFETVESLIELGDNLLR